MVVKLVKCKKCDFTGMMDIIQECGSTDKQWTCPNCRRIHINEGIID